MIRYYPLIKHQFKNTKLIMLSLPAVLALYALSFNSYMMSLYQAIVLGNSHSSYGNIFYSHINFGTMMGLCVAWAVVLCAAQSYYEKKPSVGNFISSLPYKRVTIILVRILTTVCVYTFCIFLLGVILLVLRKNYFDLYITEMYGILTGGELFASHDTAFMIVKSLFAVWLGVTVFYLAAVLAQMVVSNSFIAGAVGFVAILFPVYFVRYFSNLIYNAFNYELNYLIYLTRKLVLFDSPFIDNISYSIYYTSGAEISAALQPLNGMFPVRVSAYNTSVLTTASNLYLAAVLACAVVLFAVCLYVYSKLVCFANYSDLIAFRKASTAFAFFGGLCCALLAANFFSGAVVTMLVFVVTFIVSYFVFSKTAGRGGKKHEKISFKK